jgi:hypothetical protein
MHTDLSVFASAAFAIVFGWLLLSVIDIVGFPLARLGGRLHRYIKIYRDEKDAWLFSLLVSVTRWPTVILGSLACFLSLAMYFSDSVILSLIHGLMINTFWIVFSMRAAGIFFGAVFYGPSFANIMKSVRG